MSAAEFLAALDELDWRQADFACRVPIDQDTVSRWMKKGHTPLWVRTWLEPRLDARRLLNRTIST